jgi:hypothetical protein
MADQLGDDLVEVCCWLLAMGRLSCKGI